MNRHDQTQRQTTARALRLLPAVERLARKLVRHLPQHIDLDDLTGAGNLGLAVALEQYADADEDSFDGLAISRIRGHMLDFLRTMDPLTRRQRRAVNRHRDRRAQGLSIAPEASSNLDAAALELATQHARVDDVMDSVRDPGPAADDTLEDSYQRRMFEQALAALDPRLKTVLEMHLGEHTLRDIGQTLGVTESRACQLRAAAVKELRACMREDREPWAA